MTHSGLFHRRYGYTDEKMKTYIALFRGINVGGKNALPMKELVAILENLGARKVKTYIQSGNAVFVCKDKDAPRLSKTITAEINKCRGFEPHVLLLGLEDFWGPGVVAEWLKAAVLKTAKGATPS